MSKALPYVFYIIGSLCFVIGSVVALVRALKG